MTKSGINTSNITIRDEQGQQALTGKTAEQIKSDILTSVTTDTARENSGALKNNFDKDKVQSEINLQMEVTKNFDANRQEAKAEINKKIDDAKKENQAIIDKQKQGLSLSDQEQTQLNAYNDKVVNYQKLGVLLDSVATGLSAPTSSGLGIATATLSPVASYEIGQYFKSKDAEGSTAHILAHTVLGAAVAAAGGNDALTAGLSAGGAEAAAPKLAKYLYGKDAKDLTADEKSTISAITGLVASGVGATTGDVSNTVQSGNVAQNAVENNDFSVPYGNTNWAQGVDSLISDAKKKGLSDKEIQELLQSYKQPDAKQGRDYIEGLTKGSVELAVTSIVPELAIQKLTPIVVTASKSSWFTGVLDTFKGWFGKGDEVVPELSNINTTPIAKEGLLDNLASQMQKPIVNDKKLQNIANDLYRENAKIGNGSTGAAVRYENETGEAVGSKLHTQKANDYSEGLKEWIIKNPNASTNDKMAAEQMLRDLQNALNGK